MPKTKPTKVRVGKDNVVKYAHTAPYQIEAMVEWLEEPANYNIIIGNSNADASMKHGAGITKITGYGMMAEHVHQATMKQMRMGVEIDARLLNKWDSATCRSRWASHFKKYKSVRASLDHQTGYGTDATERITIEEGVERSCMYFSRIDKLFGNNANIQPLSQLCAPMISDTEPPFAGEFSEDDTREHGEWDDESMLHTMG